VVLPAALLLACSAARSRPCAEQPSGTGATDIPSTSATTVAKASPAAAELNVVVETIPLPGFEEASSNDPEIRRMSDRSLFVVFNCMPPCFEPDAEAWYESLGPYAHFDDELQRAAGADVVWEDREFFRIAKPKPDTVAKLREFVARNGRRRRAKP
jgi:hypothetical protein